VGTLLGYTEELSDLDDADRLESGHFPSSGPSRIVWLMLGRSDLPPPPSPPGAVPSPQAPRRKYLWFGLAGGIFLLWMAGMWAMAAGGPPINDEPSDRTRFCKLVDMGPLTGWKDPVIVVTLDATGPQGESLYAFAIDDAVWVASTDSPNDSGAILPVNEAARTYDPVTGVDVDVFQSAYAEAASESEWALAHCG
jgi:hypothetical protein